MILIFILSSIPKMRPPDLGLQAEDKIAHVIEYAILGVLLTRSAALKHPFSVRLFLCIFIIGTSYGVSDEIHQAFVPNRFASVWDAAADAIGICAGQIVYWQWKNYRSKTR